MINMEDALFEACKDNDINKALNLIHSTEIDVNTQDDFGDTPLYIATVRQNIEIIKALLTRADIKVHLKNDNNESAIDYAYLICNREIIEVFEEFEKKNEGGDWTMVDKDTPSEEEVFNELLEIDMPNFYMEPQDQNNDIPPNEDFAENSPYRPYETTANINEDLFNQNLQLVFNDSEGEETPFEENNTEPSEVTINIDRPQSSEDTSTEEEEKNFLDKTMGVICDCFEAIIDFVVDVGKVIIKCIGIYQFSAPDDETECLCNISETQQDLSYGTDATEELIGEMFRKFQDDDPYES
mgnify:CR=1 FL=1